MERFESEENEEGGGKVVPLGCLQGVAVGQTFNSKAQMAHIGMHTECFKGMCTTDVHTHSSGESKKVPSSPASVPEPSVIMTHPWAR